MIKQYKIQENYLSVKWDQGHSSQFDYIWLRDNCPTAFHPSTGERNFNLLSISEQLAPKSITLNNTDLVIVWDNGHKSSFAYDWLRNNDYSNPDRYVSEKDFEYKIWDNKYVKNIYSLSAEKILNQDDVLLDWLIQLQKYGLVLVTEMPELPNSLEVFAKRISHMRETNFGVIFEVMSKPNPNNQAYTAEMLPLHIDLPSQELPPGFQFLHCIYNESTGGSSTFVDGFAVANYMKECFPDEYNLLCKYDIPFKFQDDTHYLTETKPVFVTREEKLIEINYSSFIATTFKLPADVMRPYYLAYRKFMELVNHPDFLIRFKLNSREMVVFDNRRVLHGRDQFDPNTGKRYLRGCYVDRGDLKSKIRILKRKKRK